MSEANWYVVHTYSGYENKVKANIEKTIENPDLLPSADSQYCIFPGEDDSSGAFLLR